MPSANLALDASMRYYDAYKRLHVRMANISKANICPYIGSEIPLWEELGLRPDKIYYLYRSSDELRKAAHSFNNIQIMSLHIGVSADDPHKNVVAGSTGTDANFDGEYLRNSLVIWDGNDIRDIESGRKLQLSCGYGYYPDMSPGSFLGQHYDGVMRDIVGNHVAIVAEGRAGPDVVIGDAMPLRLSKRIRTIVEEFPMPNAKPVISGKAIYVRGALSAYLKPKLAADAQIDLKSVLLGTTASNWPEAKPVIARRLMAAAAGKLAQDASMEDVHGFLDSLDREGEDADIPEGLTGDPDPEDTNSGIDEDMDEEEKKKKEAKDKKARDMKAAKDKAAKDKAAKDKKARDMKAAKDRRAEDDDYEDDMMDAGDEAEEDETPEERAVKMREGRDRKARDKKAMDAAIGVALAQDRARQSAVREAERIVRPYIGDLAIAQDTAEDVFRFALNTLGISVNGVHPDAYKHILLAQPKPGDDRRSSPPLANDSAATKSIEERFPGFYRLKSVA